MEPRELLDLILPHLRVHRGPGAKGEYIVWCPLHPDGQGKPPHEPNLRVSERGWYCHACGRGGGLKELAKEMMIELNSGHEGPGRSRIVAAYDYRDETGALLFQVVRKEPKGFAQRCPDGKGGWIWNLNVVRRVLYRLPELLSAPDEVVWIVEGEKDADRLHSHGLLATTNPAGAGKWRSDCGECLLGRDVIILPDNDDPGRRHAHKIARSLQSIARSIKLVNLPDLPLKGDVSDWLDAGHTVAELRSLSQAAPDFDPAEAPRQPASRLRGAGPEREPVIVNLADVQPECVAWLWHPFIPLGKLTILEGDPGVGKTSLALQLAAVVSRGHAFPNTHGIPKERREPANVVYLSAEDGLADTHRPRLDACSADVARVFALTGIRERGEDGTASERAITLQDIPTLEQALTRVHPALLVVDPLQAYFGAKVDMHRANETRPVLAALAALAERHKCAALCIRHLGKSHQDRPVYRGLGSIDFAAATRSILLAAENPRNPSQRVLAHVKSSLAAKGKSIGFELGDSSFHWTGIVDLTADELLAQPLRSGDHSAVEDAADFLQEALGDSPRPVRELLREAKRHRINRASLRRAKMDMGVTVHRAGLGGARGQGEWMWSLGEQRDAPSGSRCSQTLLDHLKRLPQQTKSQHVKHPDQGDHVSILNDQGAVQDEQLITLNDRPLPTTLQRVRVAEQGDQSGTVNHPDTGCLADLDLDQNWETGTL